MEDQAWTAIGLLAGTVVGSLFYLGNRIDSLGARLDLRIDGLSGRIDGLPGESMVLLGLRIRADSSGPRSTGWQPSWTSISGFTQADLPSASRGPVQRVWGPGQQKLVVRAPVNRAH
jgi:hypothetical protein